MDIIKCGCGKNVGEVIEIQEDGKVVCDECKSPQAASEAVSGESALLCALDGACKYIETIQSCPMDAGIVDDKEYGCAERCKPETNGWLCWKDHFTKGI